MIVDILPVVSAAKLTRSSARADHEPDGEDRRIPQEHFAFQVDARDLSATVCYSRWVLARECCRQRQSIR